MSLGTAVALAVAVLAAPPPAAAPAEPSCPPRREPDSATVVVTPGARYAANALERFLFGNDYRQLWTTPIRVPLLDLAHYDGGLKVLGKGGSMQTHSLSLESANGRQYRFRSVDKDPTRLLPAALRPTFAGAVLQDQTASAIPGGSVVVGPLLDAVGVLNAPTRLFVLPADDALGEFRQQFGGMLGALEEVPRDDGEINIRGFEQVEKVVDSEKLFEHLDKHPEQHVEPQEYLKARLMDMVVGDWDRHALQWRWARRRHSQWWLPIPRDRDQAFTKFQGATLGLVRWLAPRLTVYGPRYETVAGLVWNSRDLDRRLLAPLAWPEWQAVVAEIQRRLDDATIRAAVCRLPPEHAALIERQLVRALQGRRDHLPEAARQFYRIVSDQVDVFATEGNDVARIERRGDGTVRLQIALQGSGAPWYDRVFVPGETREFRLYLQGGDDRVSSVGRGPMRIKARVIGGDGNDVLDDSQGGGVRYYDTNGENGVRRGPGTRVDTREWLPPVVGDPGDRPLDWGHDVAPVPWFNYYRDVGALLGLGVQYTTYGFRQYPYAARHTLRAGYATSARTWRFEYLGDFRRRGALEPRGEITAIASGFEVLSFYGFGNETLQNRPDSSYAVDQEHYLLSPAAVLPIPDGTLRLGPYLRYAQTHLEPGQYITAARPYGIGHYGQLGARAELVYDRRDRPIAARKGLLVTSGASYAPPLWDVRSAFGDTRAAVSSYLPLPFDSSLAVRAAGQKLWGSYPFHDAAFIGSWDTVRGLPQNRFAGDASAVANAELRVPLPRGVSLFSSNQIGLFALADAGRVFYRGQSSRRWHRAFGGGTWLSFSNGTRTISAAVARSEGDTGLYLYGGMLF